VTAMEPMVEAAEQAVLERLLAERSVRTVFQPLVALDSGRVLGFEALSRGPAGSALERPDLLFAAARRGRRLRDLDIACRAAALLAARSAGLAAPYRLFLNAEPEALDGWRPGPEHEQLPLTVVLELTERALTSQPAQLLQTVARVRALGWGVALDDVGADPASLALLPLVQPDVIKLDLALVQNGPSAHIAAVVNAVNAEAERSGTIVLAEGIESAEHLRTARAFGATVGQGWYFGRPGPLPSPLPAFSAAAPLPIVPRRPGTDDPSPFALAAAQRPARAADKRLLIEISKQLEAQAYAAGDSAIVLAAFQDAAFFTPATRRRYAGLVRSCSFVAALGEGMPAEPLPGLRGAVISPGDPLRGEWDIAVLGPHFAACLVARDLGDTGPDMTRRFEFILSHDRELTIRIAASLMSRVWPEPRTADLPQLPLPRGLLLPSPRPSPSPSPLPGTAGSPAAARSRAGLADRPPRELSALSHGLLERALDAATTGITIADMSRPDAPLIWVNAAFSELTGYPDRQVLGRNCRLLQGPATDQRTIAELSVAVAAGRQIRTRLLNQRADGMPWWNELQLSPVRDTHGTLTHYIGVQHDVTARVEAEATVLHLAYHDPLTGLPNRERLRAALTEALGRGRRPGTATALLFIDLVAFKAINDAHGHDTGDQLLREVAGRLRLALRADDLLARQGGDEFLLLLADLPAPLAPSIAERAAEDLLAALSAAFLIGGRRVSVGASIGIALAPTDTDTPEQLLRHADAAMYSAKRTAGSFWSRHPHLNREPVDDPAAPAGLPLPVQDVPADRPVQPQQVIGG
jgi:diguanylate cyclase (GGDEF)-like protein/PAS domain S-box-containing protein